MQKSSGISSIQNAVDVNVSLGVGVDGYVLSYDHDTSKFVLIEPSECGASALVDCTDVDVTLGADVDEYALCYDHDTARFVLRQVTIGSCLLATGATVGASSQAQAFTSGVKSGLLFPAADSTAAIKLCKADGSTAVITIDTTNSRLGVGCTPGGTLEVAGNGTGKPDVVFDPQDNSYAYFHCKTNYQRLLFCGGSSASSGAGGYFQVIGNSWSGLSGFRGRVIFTCGLPSSPTGQEGSLTVYTGGSERLCVYTDGKFGFGGVTPGVPYDFGQSDAITNAVTDVLTVRHASSGTPGAGFGLGVVFGLESSTTENQTAAKIQVVWSEATHATRKSIMILSAYDTAEREGIKIGANGSAATLGFLGSAPSAQLVHVADVKGDYGVGDLDSEADVIASVNALAAAINSLNALVETFGFRAVS